MFKMKPSLDIVFFLSSIYLTWINQVRGGDSTFEETKECSTYSEKLASFPDLHNMIRYKRRRQEDFDIDSVKNTNRERSFYWCELDIEETDTIYRRYRHFGFNSTYWWVEKGCGGWFWVTECRRTVTSPALTAVHRKPDGLYSDDIDDDEEEDEEEEEGGGGDKTDILHDNLSPPSLNKVSLNLNPPSETLRVHSGQTLISAGDKFLPPPSPGNDREVISSGRHSDTKMSHGSNKNAVEENVGEGGAGLRESNNGGGKGGGDLQSPQSVTGVGVGELPARYPHPTGTSDVVSSNSSVDDLYRGWPLMGYDYPTSKEMWDALDRITWVDVKAQLGFYTKYGRVDSDIFD